MCRNGTVGRWDGWAKVTYVGRRPCGPWPLASVLRCLGRAAVSQSHPAKRRAWRKFPFKKFALFFSDSRQSSSLKTDSRSALRPFPLALFSALVPSSTPQHLPIFFLFPLWKQATSFSNLSRANINTGVSSACGAASSVCPAILTARW
ncbi:hypothetical protein K458DRAFT_41691 [Lentithecium fluviatile CBS 122367]|uniref:Uncharacterized protein n=1 Tax=Lentithecium fluviatile CBS 122367 TaxID=1168545 RepID=A0A6G1IZN0_9PLEO|nr:hypothetical protein K458DRAFT_41691 [Lentithecium fluviatile CBS 122367]